MDVGAFEARLPAGQAMPAALRALVACSQALGSDYLTTRTALVGTDDGNLAAWTGGASALQSGLWLFARNVGHDLYAVWLTSGADLAHAPVVRLDSEGVGNQVVAANLADFARKLAAGAIDDTTPSPALAGLQALSVPRGASIPTDAMLEAWIDAALAQSADRGAANT